jgi:hypothetical protein
MGTPICESGSCLERHGLVTMERVLAGGSVGREFSSVSGTKESATVRMFASRGQRAITPNPPGCLSEERRRAQREPIQGAQGAAMTGRW